MSDTPRTDSSELPHALDDHHFVVGAFFARQLERELNAASKERDDALMMLGMYRMKSDEQKQRIKRLEEAGDELLWAFCPASVSMMTERESDALKLWNKAKEAKLSVNPIQLLGANLIKAGIGFTTEDKP